MVFIRYNTRLRFSSSTRILKSHKLGFTDNTVMASIYVLPENASRPTENGIGGLLKKVSKELCSGGVIAVPTDTIYGIAALANSTGAVRRIYEIKKRQAPKPVAICVGDIEDIPKWAKVAVPKEILTDLLPGPVTLVFERTTHLNPELNPGTSLVGVRIPNHQVIRRLCYECDEPLALTSANLSSGRSPLKIEEFQHLWDKLDVVIDGGLLSDTEETRLGSTVVNLSQPGSFNIIRPGCAYKSTVNILKNKYNLKEF